MIARTWHGRVPAEKADAYHDYLRRTGLADFAATPGNLGAWVFRRTDGDVTHYLLTSLWESWEAIERFAGEDLEREPFVTHFEVLEGPRADAG